jgi:hypothetical protein
MDPYLQIKVKTLTNLSMSLGIVLLEANPYFVTPSHDNTTMAAV